MQHTDYAGKDKAREILRMVLKNDWEIISPILQPYKWQGCKFENISVKMKEQLSLLI